MTYDSNGYLEINTSFGGGAFPIPNANIKISGGEEGNETINYSVITDNDGKTLSLTLPTSSKIYSLEPNGKEGAYSVYTVEAYAPGFYPKIINNVAVFSGIKSLLPIEMIPNGGLVKNTDMPLGDNKTTIIENEDLQ